MPLAAGTAFEVVARRLDLQRDERVVIFGAAGGVGGFATHWRSLAALRSVAVGRRRRSHGYLKSLGAALTIDHGFDDAVAQIADAVGEVDGRRSTSWEAAPSWRACRCCARAAASPRPVASFAGDLELAIDRNLTLHGVLVRPDGARLAELAALLERGELRTTIRGEHPLEDTATAHREVLRGGVPGKTVIRVR